MSKKIKVLIVDDTVLYRKILKDTLSTFSQVEIVGTAPNGKIALSKIPFLNPDIMTLDIEMPELNGLETLRKLKLLKNAPSALMVSAHTTKDAGVTMEALNLGAFDFIAKPYGGDINTNVETLKNQFDPILKAFLARQGITFGQAYEGKKEDVTTEADTIIPPKKEYKKISAMLKPAIVAIGISTGGPKALVEVISNLDANLKVPVIIVQHMPPIFTKALADSLNQKTELNVKEGASGDIIEAGNIYIAPGGKQMKIKNDDENSIKKLLVTDDPPENFCKPAVDYLFRSVASVYGKKSLGIIMTGMGRDGVVGIRLMKRHSAGIIAQNRETSVVFGMPAEAIKSGCVDYIASLHEIAPEINRICRGF
jgi:two-component system, chemotaxis family, protein-glutamate methylesterase/glutaminase